jgi:hypothetical protein
MKSVAAEVGVLPHQFQAVVGAAVQALHDAGTSDAGEAQGKHDANIQALKEQHGQMFDNQVKLAGLGLKGAAGDQAKAVSDLLTAAGLGTEPHIINFLAKIGESYTEDSAVGLNGGTSPVAVQNNLAEADRLQAAAVTEKDAFKQKEMINKAVELRKAAHGE